jgi:outer membrane biosynthesis protein TonB
MDMKHALEATQTPAIDRGRGELYWLTGLVVISVAVHLVAILSMRSDHAAPRPKARTLMTMTVTAPKPVAKPATPTPAAEPEAARAAPRITQKRTSQPAKAVVAAAPQQAETPADFTGVTLTNDAAGAWATPVGNGGAMTGPVGTPGAHVTGRSRTGTGGAVPEGPRTVGIGDLSQPPRAPVLSDKLERNYPDDARSLGVRGKAVMRLRVMPDGHVRDLVVVAESHGGFGEACKQTLRDSVWSPPLDLEARPVSTVVSYTCTFEVH